MLIVYSGVPGSGKTYHAVRDLAMCEYPAITNIQVKGLDNVCVMPLREITPDFLRAFSHRAQKVYPRISENDLTLVIDEAQLLFSSRTWSEKGRFEFLEFFSQHRKYLYRVILISQNIEMIDRQIRFLCEQHVTHTAVTSVSMFTKALGLLGLRACCANHYYFGTDIFLFRDMFMISDKYGRFYNTRQDIVNDFVDDYDLSEVLARMYSPFGYRRKPSPPRKRKLRGVEGFLRQKKGELAPVYDAADALQKLRRVEL